MFMYLWESQQIIEDVELMLAGDREAQEHRKSPEMLHGSFG
jgi:hypothetical protein